MTTPTGARWRPVVAALANDEARATWCRLQLGESADVAMAEVPLAKRERVLQSLARAGLIVRRTAEGATTDGAITAAAPFADLLAAEPVTKAEGVEKFLRDGRIERFPMDAATRHALLLHVAERAFRPDDELTEAQVNERLTVFSDDRVTLRRYLVDAGILERTRSGSSYALSPLRSEPVRSEPMPQTVASPSTSSSQASS
jgi:hypothetical protein